MGIVSSAATPATATAPAAPAGKMRLSRLSDELLARYAARGSERAYAAVYERYYQALYRYCRSIVRNDADAQDALQSTFTGALAALQRGQRSAPLRPWLYRIAHNESISLLRRRARESDAALSDESAGVASSTEEVAAGRARWQALVEDLGALPERQRGALLLRELAGLSHEEISVALGLTVGTAKQAIFEARQGLTEVHEGRAMSCHEVRQRISEGDRRVLRGRRVRAHLRACSSCDGFARAIPARRAELLALAPVLPPAAAMTVFSRALHAASSHGGASAAATAGAVGKAAGTAIAWKALGGAVVVLSAAAGVGGLTHVLGHHHSGPRAVGAHPAAATFRAGSAGAKAVPPTRRTAAIGHGASPVRAGAAPASHPGAGRHASKAKHPGPRHTTISASSSTAAASAPGQTTYRSGSLGPTRSRSGHAGPQHRSQRSSGRNVSHTHRVHEQATTHTVRPTSTTVQLNTAVTPPEVLPGKHQ